MDKDEAVSILMLKSEQQIKMINMLNSQLENSNIEKSQFRLQVIALQNDNMTLRREKEVLKAQIEQLQKQFISLEQNKDIQVGQGNLVGESQQQNSEIFKIDYNKEKFIQQEYQKLLDQNTQLLQNCQSLESKIHQQNFTIQQFEHQILEIQNEIKFKEALILQKDHHLKEYEKKITNIQDFYQEQIYGLQYQQQKMRDQMLQLYHQDENDNENNRTAIYNLISNAGNKDKNLSLQIKNDQQQKYLPQNQIPQLQQLPLSSERINTDINEIQPQSSGRQNIKQSINYPGQLKQSNEQNTFQFNTVQSEFSSYSQPKISERIKNSDYN